MKNVLTGLFRRLTENAPENGAAGGKSAGNSAGFTLIELLVVVLIIGILAGVALPRYEIAVEKSRLGALIPLGRTVREAQDAYFMATGEYTVNPDDLDIKIECPKGYDCDFSRSIAERKFNLRPTGKDYGLTFSYATRATMEGADVNYCSALRSNPKAVRICKSFGKDYTESDGTWVRVRIQ